MESLEFEAEFTFPRLEEKPLDYFDKLRAGKLVADRPKIKK
jgi:hypothetical protein